MKFLVKSSYERQMAKTKTQKLDWVAYHSVNLVVGWHIATRKRRLSGERKCKSQKSRYDKFGNVLHVVSPVPLFRFCLDVCHNINVGAGCFSLKKARFTLKKTPFYSCYARLLRYGSPKA